MMGLELSSHAPTRTISSSRRIVPKRLYVLVLVAGLLGTMITAAFLVRRPGVYYSRVSVLFLAPASTRYPNRLLTGSDSLITTAGVVGKMVAAGETNLPVVSDAVTLPSEGVRHGFSVKLPNDGGQWADNFDKAQLDVQAVAGTNVEVAALLGRVIGEINTDLARLQDEAGTLTKNRITTRITPPQPPVYFNTGSKIRTLAGIFLLGIGLSVALASGARRFAVRRTAR